MEEPCEAIPERASLALHVRLRGQLACRLRRLSAKNALRCSSGVEACGASALHDSSAHVVGLALGVAAGVGAVVVSPNTRREGPQGGSKHQAAVSHGLKTLLPKPDMTSLPRHPSRTSLQPSPSRLLRGHWSDQQRQQCTLSRGQLKPQHDPSEGAICFYPRDMSQAFRFCGFQTCRSSPQQH